MEKLEKIRLKPIEFEKAKKSEAPAILMNGNTGSENSKHESEGEKDEGKKRFRFTKESLKKLFWRFGLKKRKKNKTLEKSTADDTDDTADMPKPFPWKSLSVKNILVASCFVLIAVAGYINIRYYTDNSGLVPSDGEEPGNYAGDETPNGEVGASPQTSENSSGNVIENSDDYFAVAVISRQRVRDESVELLMTMLESEATTAQQREEISLEMTKISDEITAEVNIENLIKAKGMKECVAVVSDGMANIVVGTEALTPSQIAQIKEIVYLNADIHPKNVKIIEKALQNDLN